MGLSLEAIAQFHCPRWGELPSVALYMDQIIILLDESLAVFADEKEHVVTSTMINNYVKQKFISAPEKKKYAKRHIAFIIVVSVLKRVLSINEIVAIMNRMVDKFGAERAYDTFCGALEHMLRDAFSLDGAGIEAIHISPDMEKGETERILYAALTALTGKMYVQFYIAPNDDQQ